MTVTLKTMITDWLRIKTQVGTPATPASGYSVIYEEGGALKLKTDAGTITTFGSSTVSDTAYDATSWNGVTTISPSKNAVRDKIESMAAVTNDYIMVSDRKSQNTAGGTFTSGAWRTRDINTEDSDTGNHCSVASNQITLGAGTYICHITCPSWRVASHIAKLYDTTGAADLLFGTSEYTESASNNAISKSIVRGKFTLSIQSVLEVRHYSSATTATSGFGVPTNITGETYTVAEFWKVA